MQMYKNILSIQLRIIPLKISFVYKGNKGITSKLGCNTSNIPKHSSFLEAGTVHLQKWSLWVLRSPRNVAQDKS